MSSNYHRHIHTEEASQPLLTEYAALHRWFSQQEKDVQTNEQNSENKPLPKAKYKSKVLV